MIKRLEFSNQKETKIINLEESYIMRRKISKTRLDIHEVLPQFIDTLVEARLNQN